MEKVRVFSKSLLTAAALATLMALGVLFGPPYVGADDDDNGAQDEKQMIRIGLAVAPVPLNITGKDRDMVGLGSYIVNVAACCCR